MIGQWGTTQASVVEIRGHVVQVLQSSTYWNSTIEPVVTHIQRNKIYSSQASRQDPIKSCYGSSPDFSNSLESSSDISNCDLFLEKSAVFVLLFFPNKNDTSPSCLFLETSNNVKFAWPNLVGIVPYSADYGRGRDRNPFGGSLQNDSGMLPVSLLQSKRSPPSFGRWESEGGIEPVTLLNDRPM